MINVEIMTAQELAVQAMLYGGKNLLGQELRNWSIGLYSGSDPGEKEKEKAETCMNKIKEAIEITNEVARHYEEDYGKLEKA